MSASVLVVEDDPELRTALCDILGMAGFSTFSAGDGQAAMKLLADEAPGLVLSDIKMEPMDGLALLKSMRPHYPSIPVLFMTAYGTIRQAVDAMREGAADYLVKPFEAEVLVSKVSRYLEVPPANSAMVAEDPRSKAVVELARRVAGSDVTVMISGESGTGKEVLARFVHDQSARAEGPFVAINCAAIPDNMLEAVLFGYEKGAFTGAYKACPGKFEQAGNGTLLLDEISEMDLGLQAKLLRVLQEREVERLGSSKLIALDVRVLATTNRDLKKEVEAGRFREDLYYRLNVFPLAVPPLRERRGDIPALADFLVTRFGDNPAVRPGFSEAAVASLCSQPWPGNIRELDNVIQRAMVLQVGDCIDVADLCLETEGIAKSSESILVPAPAVGEALEDKLKEREYGVILTALNEAAGNRSVVAKNLGISPRTLRYKLARMRTAGIEVPA